MAQFSGVSRVGLRGGGGSKSHKFKWLVKVGASKGVIVLDLKKNHGRGRGSWQTKNGYAPAVSFAMV